MTADVTQEKIRGALGGLLAALARTLLRCGVSYAEFADMAKKAFVDAALADYGVRNRPTNIARVAVMTGLSRKEVSRIRRDAKARRANAQTSITLPAAILNVWHTNRRYQDKSGQPRVLPYSGAGLSFSSLVRSISRDIPPGAMRHELVRAGALHRLDRGHLVPIKRYFVPDSADDRILVGLELGLRRLAETVAFNSDRRRRGEPKFQRFVEGQKVATSDLPSVRAELHRLLAQTSLTYDDVLTSLPKHSPISESAGVRVGIGLYYFDEAAD